MAENTKTEETFATKLNDSLTKFRGLILAVVLCVIVVVLVVLGVLTISTKSTEKALAQVDEIYYELTKDGASLEADAVAGRQSKALEDLAAYSSKGGIVGVRASMLEAELYFQMGENEKARDSWVKAASAKKSSYTAALAYFNAAVASEKIDDAEGAANFYKSASEAEDFLLVDHALFSLGRVNEGLGKMDEAKAAYQKVIDTHPNGEWANLSKGRLIALELSSN